MNSVAPRRIASLLASSTEMLFALGFGDRVVGISHECDYPADACRLPRLTRTRIDDRASSGEIDRQVRAAMETGAPLYEIDVERMAALAPDLIVTQAQCDVCAVRLADVEAAVRGDARLADAKIVALNPRRLGDIFADIQRVADAAGADRVGAQLVQQLEARVERVRRAAGALPSTARPRVVCLEWLEPLMIAANWMPELVELAGGQYPLANAGAHSVYNTWDEITAFDPEVLLVMPCGFGLPRTLEEWACLTRLPGWSDLAAVRGGRVVAVDGNAYFNRSGPRMVDSLELLAHLLHPTRCVAPPSIFEHSAVWP